MCVQVLEVKAGRRTGPMNFMTCLRKTLEKHYGTKPVGLGGTFLIEAGKAKLHVMVGRPTSMPQSIKYNLASIQADSFIGLIQKIHP